MCDLIKSTAKEVVLIGEAALRFEENLRKRGFENIRVSASMEDAVKVSFDAATAGDKVLLSPACASFDMFDNFEHRGDVFKELVRKLKNAGN